MHGAEWARILYNCQYGSYYPIHNINLIAGVHNHNFWQKKNSQEKKYLSEKAQICKP